MKEYFINDKKIIIITELENFLLRGKNIKFKLDYKYKIKIYITVN